MAALPSSLPPPAVAEPAPPAEVREREASPWLGRGLRPSDAFLRYQDLQRRLSSALGGLATPIAPATQVGFRAVREMVTLDGQDSGGSSMIGPRLARAER